MSITPQQPTMPLLRAIAWRKHLHLLLLCCAFLSILASAQRTRADSRHLNGSTVSIDEGASRNWMQLDKTAYPWLVVNLVVDGKNVPALLDTGTTHTVIDLAVAVNLGLKTQLAGKLESLAGSIDLSTTTFTSFELGAFRQSGGMIGVVDLSHVRRMGNNEFSAIVGSDILANIALQVDWDQDRVRLLSSGTKAFSGERIPLRFNASTHQFLTTLSLNGHELDQVAIDTGGNGTISLLKSVLLQLSISPDRITDRLSYVAGGTVLRDYFRVDRVNFGEQRFERMPAEAASSVVAGLPSLPAQIEMEFLQQFNFLMDATDGYITTSPRDRSPEPPQSTTSGVQGVYRDDGLSIYHVMRGSPAEKAGLTSGDRVCMVDDDKIDRSWEHGQQRSWSVGEPGRRVDLGLCDGTIKSLTLAQFY